MPAITCPTHDDLRSLIQGGIETERIGELESHVGHCGACLEAIRDLLPSDGAFDQALQALRNTQGDQDNATLREVIRKLRSRAGESKISDSRLSEASGAMVSLVCEGCQKKLAVKEALRGKRVKCPKCAMVLKVPEAMPMREQQTLLPEARNTDVGQATVPPSTPQSEQATRPPATQPEATQDHAKKSLSEASDDADTHSLTDFLAPAEAEDELGRLGGYRVLKILGHGGMGVVYLAEDVKLKRPVALKAMLPALAASASAGKRFLREAQSMAKVEHDHIVRVYQVGEERGVPYLAMEFLKGEPLDKRLERERKLSPADVISLGKQMAEGLAAAHEHDLVHRDIKPGNVWLESRQGGSAVRVKILDFGLARAASQDSGLTQQGAIIGTPSYMSPEQARGDAVDARCDLWALGVALYRMATGTLPFRGNDTVSTLMAVALNTPETPANLDASIPEGLSDVIMQLLEKDLSKRVATAREVVDLLTALDVAERRPASGERKLPDSKTSKKNQGTNAPRSPGAPRRPLVLAGIAMAFLAVAVAGIVFFLQTPDGTVRIEIDDPKIKVAFNDGAFDIQGAGKHPVLIKPGKHGLKIQRDGFTFETTNFEYRKGENLVLKVDWINEGKVQVTANNKLIGEQKAIATNSATAQPVWTHALDFDGRTSYVHIPTLKLPAGPFTTEAWVKRRTNQPEVVVIGAGACLSSLYFHPNVAGQYLLDPERCLRTAGAAVTSATEFVHIAGVWDGKSLRCYVNGSLVSDRFAPDGEPHNDTTQESFLGAQRDGAKAGQFVTMFHFNGLMVQARYSSRALYNADFTPADRLESSADTLALYQFNEGQGNQLKDTSGKNHHGKIVNAKWVRSDKSSEIDLLAAVDPEKMSGSRIQWKREADGLVGKGIAKKGTSDWAGVVFPTPLSGDYDLEIDLEQKKYFPLQIDLPLGDRAIRVSLSPGSSALMQIDGKDDNNALPGYRNGAARLTTGVTQKLLASVRQRGDEVDVAVSLDGATVGIFSGKRTRITLPHWVTPNKKNISFAGLSDQASSMLTFSRAVVTVREPGSALPSHFTPISPTNPVTPSVPTNLSLELNGKDAYVEIDSISRKTLDPFTMELWVKLNDLQHTTIPLPIRMDYPCHSQILFYAESGRWTATYAVRNDKNAQAEEHNIDVDGTLFLSRWAHLALVFDRDAKGFAVRFYIDGKLKNSKALPDNLVADQGKSVVRIGAAPGHNNQLHAYFGGCVDEVRLSSVARYKEDFEPKTRLEPDTETIALYHCDEGKGDKLIDSSGKNHHGKIVRAKWTPRDSPPPAPDHALLFAGKEHVEIPNLKLDVDSDVTIEAWARSHMKDRGHGAIAAFAQQITLAGTSMPNQWTTDLHGVERQQLMAPDPELPLLVHLAAVVKKKTLKLFVDGKLISETETDGLAAPLDKSPAFLGGNPLNNSLFHGVIDEVRISKSARYAKDFTPQRRFSPDADTLGLYHCDEGSGLTLKDSSGKDNHGRLRGAKWVKADGVEAVSLPPTDQPFVKLHDGKQFTGWQPYNLNARLDDQDVVIGPSQDGLLTYMNGNQPAAVADFEASFLARYEGGTNGIQFELRHDYNTLTRFSMCRHTWGHLTTANYTQNYPATPESARVTRHDDFNFVQVRCIGKHLTVTINGVIAQDRDVEMQPAGRVVFHVFNGTREFRIRDFRMLDMGRSPPKQLEKGQTKIAGNALFFNGRTSHVLTPLKYDGSHPLTVEATVRLVPGGDRLSALISNNSSPKRGPFGASLIVATNQNFGAIRSERGADELLTSPPNSLDCNQTYRLAAVWNKKQVNLYVDGKKQPQSINPSAFGLTSETFPFMIGAEWNDGKLGFHCAAMIDEVRFSKSARFDKDYEPKERLDADDDTLALYHFDEGKGDVAKDASKNGNDAKIADAHWIEAGHLSHVPIAPGEFGRTGAIASVDVPTLKWGVDDSFTFEAYVTAFDHSAPSMIVGHRQASLWHTNRFLAMGAVGADGAVKHAQATVLPLRQKVHLAGVREQERLTLFLDGVQVADQFLTGKKLIETKNSLGIGGVHGIDPENPNPFFGIIEQVRISKTARYRGNFTPAAKLAPDADTLAAYDLLTITGSTLTDLSGNGHHGTVVRRGEPRK